MRSPGFYGSSPTSASREGAGRLFVATRYFTTMHMGADTTGAITQNLENAYRFEVGETRTFDRIGVEVTTGVAATTVRLGIRSSTTGGEPGDLVVDAGTIDSSGTGFLEKTISTTLTPGRYWVTCALQGGTGVSVRARTISDPFVGQAVNTTYNAMGYYQSGVSGALPATFTVAGPVAVGAKILLRAA